MDWNDQLQTSLIWLGKAFAVSSIGLTITIYFLAQFSEWGRLVRRISWEYFNPFRSTAPLAWLAGFEPGQRVMASIPCGGLAEWVCAAAARCIAIPDDLLFDMAAAFQVTYGTAYHALVDRGALKSGETLLVLGASGGVGLAAVELGRALGARVLAAVSSVGKAEVALRNGATDALVYPESPERNRLRSVASPSFVLEW